MLTVHRLCTSYGSDNVLHGINLEVREGEIVTLVGANGAGKSTLMKTLSGLMTPTSGEILFLGERIDNRPVSARLKMGLAHVPEGRQVFGGLSVLDNIMLGGHIITDGGDAGRLAEVRALFPALGKFEGAPAASMSGGQQQLLAIARGLMAAPRLLLLDEPSLGVAPLLVQEIFKLIASLRDKGVSVLLAEQNARAALSIADRGYVLENGRIAYAGRGREMLHSQEVADRYLGGGSTTAISTRKPTVSGEDLKAILNL